MESPRPRSFQKGTHHFTCPQKCYLLSSYIRRESTTTQCWPFANLLSYPWLLLFHHASSSSQALSVSKTGHTWHASWPQGNLSFWVCNDLSVVPASLLSFLKQTIYLKVEGTLKSQLHVMSLLNTLKLGPVRQLRGKGICSHAWWTKFNHLDPHTMAEENWHPLVILNFYMRSWHMPPHIHTHC